MFIKSSLHFSMIPARHVSDGNRRQAILHLQAGRWMTSMWGRRVLICAVGAGTVTMECVCVTLATQVMGDGGRGYTGNVVGWGRGYTGNVVCWGEGLHR